jgi:hypothetical protein
MRRRSKHPGLAVITDHEFEDVEEGEDTMIMSKKVAEDLTAVHPNDPTSPGHRSLDGNEFRSRRRERLSRLAKAHRSTSPQKQSVMEERMDPRLSRSLSPLKKPQGILFKKERCLSPKKLPPGSQRETTPEESDGRTPSFSTKGYSDHHDSAFEQAPSPKNERAGGHVSSPKAIAPVSSPKTFFPEDDRIEQKLQDRGRNAGTLIKKYTSKRYKPSTSNHPNTRALLEKKHASIRASMLRKTRDPVESVGSDEYDDLSPRPHRSPVVVHYEGPHSPNNRGTMSPLRSQDSDDTSTLTSNFQRGIPCVSQVFHSTEKFSNEANGCVGGYVQKGTSFVSGVWQSCASGIGGYQTESKKSLLQLEMIAEQSVSSIFQEQHQQGRRSPEAFRHTRDLLAQKEEEQRDEDEQGNTFVRGVEDTLTSLGTKVQQVVGFRDMYGGNAYNREQSMMDDMRNMFDSISKFAITPHHTYMGTDEVQEQHRFFEYRYGNNGFGQQPYGRFHHSPGRQQPPLPQQHPPQETSRAPMFTEESTDEEESHHVRKQHQVQQGLNMPTRAPKELQLHAASASIYTSVARGTKDRRSMFMELQRRRKKHGLVKEEEEEDEETQQHEPKANVTETPIKVDAGNLRNVYLRLYDKIHDETGKSLEQLEDADSIAEESDEDGHEYAVVWAASEEGSLSPQHRAVHAGSLIDADTASEDAFDRSGKDRYAEIEPFESKRSAYGPIVDGAASTSTSTREFLDANQYYQSFDDADSTKAYDGQLSRVPSSARKADDESSHEGPALLPNATSTTHTDHTEEMVSSFLQKNTRSPLADMEEENQDNPKIDSKVQFLVQHIDEESVGSEEDRTLADSTMVSGNSTGSHTHDLSMDETIDTLGASYSRSRSSRSSSNSCELSEVPPEIPHPLGPISEYQVLYQISEEDEEAEMDAASAEEAHDTPFDEESSIRSDRTWSVGSMIKSLLRWTIILAVANTFGFFHWLLDVPLSASDVSPTAAAVEEASQDPVRVIRGASYYEIPTDGDRIFDNDNEPSSMPSFLFPDDYSEILDDAVKHNHPNKQQPLVKMENDMYRQEWVRELRNALDDDNDEKPNH